MNMEYLRESHEKTKAELLTTPKPSHEEAMKQIWESLGHPEKYKPEKPKT